MHACQHDARALVFSHRCQRWLGRAKFALEAKIFRFDPADESQDPYKVSYDKIPKERIVATIYGSWKGKIYIVMSADKVATARAHAPRIAFA